MAPNIIELHTSKYIKLEPLIKKWCLMKPNNVEDLPWYIRYDYGNWGHTRKSCQDILQIT